MIIKFLNYSIVISKNEIVKDEEDRQKTSEIDTISILYKYQKKILGFGILLLLIGLLFYFFIFFNKAFFHFGGYIKSSNASELGGALSGIAGVLISASSIIFLILTFVSQIRNSRIAQIENVFIKMIEFHRDNINHFQLKDSNSKNSLEYQTVIKYFVLQFEAIFDAVKSCNLFAEEKKVVELTNYIFFYGIDNFKLRINTNEFNDVSLEKLRKMLNTHHPYNGYEGKLNRENEEYLGHYFRNLFKAYKYIDENTLLTDDEKEEFINLLNSELSGYEQTLIFLNSLSELGVSWLNKKYFRTYNVVEHSNMDFIFKVNFLKEKYNEETSK